MAPNSPENQTVVEQIKSVANADALTTVLEQKWAKTELWNKMQDWFENLTMEQKSSLNTKIKTAIENIYSIDDNGWWEDSTKYPEKWTDNYNLIQALASLDYFVNHEDKDKNLTYWFTTGKLAEENAKDYIEKVIFTRKLFWEELFWKDDNLKKIEKRSVNNTKYPSKLNEDVNAYMKNQIGDDLAKKNLYQLQATIWSLVWWNNKLQQNEIKKLGISREFWQNSYESIVSMLKIKGDNDQKVNFESNKIFTSNWNIDDSLSFDFNGFEVKNRAKDDLVKLVNGRRLVELAEWGSNKFIFKDPSSFVTISSNQYWDKFEEKISIPDANKVLILEEWKLVEKVAVYQNKNEYMWVSIAGINNEKFVNPSYLS